MLRPRLAQQYLTVVGTMIVICCWYSERQLTTFGIYFGLLMGRRAILCVTIAIFKIELTFICSSNYPVMEKRGQTKVKI